jgi:hypothetical protein
MAQLIKLEQPLVEAVRESKLSKSLLLNGARVRLHTTLLNIAASYYSFRETLHLRLSQDLHPLILLSILNGGAMTAKISTRL